MTKGPIRVKLKTTPIPQVFIIESIRLKEEKEGKWFEGKILSGILSLIDRKPIYYYLRTKEEFKEILDLFSESNYRYLHISCHGTASHIHITLDRLDFKEFGKLITPYIDKRRLFISECSIVNDDLADVLFQQSGCFSLIGPADYLEFSDAAFTWASLYHLMFSADESSQGKKILSILQNLANTFSVSLNYYSCSGIDNYDKRTDHWFKKTLLPSEK